MAAYIKSERLDRFITPEQLARMRRLRDQEGLAWDVIGRRFGHSGSHVKKVVKGKRPLREVRTDAAE